jgi:hypothetical protein
MWKPNRTCAREAEVWQSVRAGIDDPALRAHAVTCAGCHETLAVAAWMRELGSATTMDGSPVQNPEHIWWRAQVLRRWDAQRKALTPIAVGEQVQVGIGLAGAVVLLALLWRQLPTVAPPAASLATATTVTIVSSVLLLTLAVIAVRQLRWRD